MLLWIELESVRNLLPQRVALESELTVVSGLNAQGKTSLLEAAYLLATTRSYRSTEPRDLIARDASGLLVRGAVRWPGTTGFEIGIGLGKQRGERVLSVGQYDAKLADYLGLLPTLALSGESGRLVVASPSERRRYMDRATAAADPAHLPDLAAYRRALAQRNQLLRAGAPDPLLEPWDAIVVRHGEAVSRRRRIQMEAWQPELAAWPDLFPEGSAARLVYREAGQPRGENLSLEERLERSRDRDRREGTTSVGPHRDDLLVDIDGSDLLRYGSAGQVRSALAAITLAQARQVRRSRDGKRPLLVLDDVDTDLDPERLDGLLGAAAQEGQVLAATSKPGSLVPAGALRLVAHEGRIERT